MTPSTSLPSQEGIVLIDKPVGISSFGVVAQVRRTTGIKRVGHAGTLDPLASGLLIVLVGRTYTRQADQFLKLDKAYEIELTLGQTSASGDAEGPLTSVSQRRPTDQEVAQTLSKFSGNLMQTPPRFSAIKINGRRAYQRARDNEQFRISARPVTIYALALEHYSYPRLRLHTHVSSGTYIRSLVEDIGQALGVGAYVSGLRRTQIGDYKIADAIALDK